MTDDEIKLEKESDFFACEGEEMGDATLQGAVDDWVCDLLNDGAAVPADDTVITVECRKIIPVEFNEDDVLEGLLEAWDGQCLYDGTDYTRATPEMHKLEKEFLEKMKAEYDKACPVRNCECIGTIKVRIGDFRRN